MKILEKTITKQNNEIIMAGNVETNDVLVIGVFHGDEQQGEFLINEYIKDSKNSKLLFIPCLNPDGRDLNIRQNTNNVDLNRNFPTKNWIINEDSAYFGGENPNSEIETQFMVKIIEKYKPKAILTLHAPYCVVNYDGDAIYIAKKISEIMLYPVESDIGYPTPGSFGTYCGVERQIPTITLELDEKVDVNELLVPVHKVFKFLETL